MDADSDEIIDYVESNFSEVLMEIKHKEDVYLLLKKYGEAKYATQIFFADGRIEIRPRNILDYSHDTISEALLSIIESLAEIRFPNEVVGEIH